MRDFHFNAPGGETYDAFTALIALGCEALENHEADGISPDGWLVENLGVDSALAELCVRLANPVAYNIA